MTSLFASKYKIYYHFIISSLKFIIQTIADFCHKFSYYLKGDFI